MDPDGRLQIPGEAVTDPVAYTLGLAAARRRAHQRPRRVDRAPGRPARTLDWRDGGHVSCRVAVNCAGLHADEVARLAGDDSFEIYPRKGEFFVFDPPGGRPLDRILLPVPTKRTKGVLVFPTIDGKVVAGPTAHDGEDKTDWSVRPEARDEVLSKARAMLPALEGAEPVAAYAGLRPAGRGVNYVIGQSRACPGLVNAAAIRSTGLSASLGIAEHVLGLDRGSGRGARPRPRRAGDSARTDGPWWLRTARHRGMAA